MTDSDEVFQRAATLGHYERLKNLTDPKWRAVSGFSFGENTAWRPSRRQSASSR